MGLIFPEHFTLHLLPLKFIRHFIMFSLCFFLASFSQLAHSTDTLNNSVLSANLIAPLFTLFHVTLAYPTFILLFHACLVSLKAFSQELCQTPFGNCRLCQLDHVYTHACRPSPLKNSRDFWEVGFPLQKQPWILPRRSYLYIHPNTPQLSLFLVTGSVHNRAGQPGCPAAPGTRSKNCVTDQAQSKGLPTHLGISLSRCSTAFGKWLSSSGDGLAVIG